MHTQASRTPHVCRREACAATRVHGRRRSIGDRIAGVEGAALFHDFHLEHSQSVEALRSCLEASVPAGAANLIKARVGTADRLTKQEDELRAAEALTHAQGGPRLRCIGRRLLKAWDLERTVAPLLVILDEVRDIDGCCGEVDKTGKAMVIHARNAGVWSSPPSHLGHESRPVASLSQTHTQQSHWSH